MGIRDKIEDKIFEAAYNKFQKLKRWQKITIFLVAGLTMFSYFIVPSLWQKLHNPEIPTFPEGIAGILISRIHGDDPDNSLQRYLVREVTKRLKFVTTTKIKVLPSNKPIAADSESESARKQIKEIGTASKAFMVIWGDRIKIQSKDQSIDKFYPRITLVKGLNDNVFDLENPILPDTSVIRLSSVLVNKPIYLYHLTTGFINYKLELYTSALELFERALEVKDIGKADKELIQLLIGSTHYLIGVKEYLQDDIDRAVSIYKQTIETMEQIIETAEEKSIEFFRLQIFLSLINNLSVVLLNESQFLKAIDYLQKAEKVCSDLVEKGKWCGIINYHLADAYIEKGMYEKAIDYLEKGINDYEKYFEDDEKSSDDRFLMDAKQNIVYAYTKMGDSENGDNMNDYYLKAENVWNSSSQFFEKVQNKASLANYYRNRGRICIWKKDWDCALDVLEKGKKRNPDHPDVYLLLATAFLGDGNGTESKENFSIFIEKAANKPEKLIEGKQFIKNMIQ